MNDSVEPKFKKLALCEIFSKNIFEMLFLEYVRVLSRQSTNPGVYQLGSSIAKKLYNLNSENIDFKNTSNT